MIIRHYLVMAVMMALLYTGLANAQYKTEFADTVTLNSSLLPYSVPKSDMLILTDGNLTASGTAIDIGDRNDIMIDGGGDTIFFGTAGGDDSYGVKLSFSPERIQIRNITIIHDVDDSSPAEGCAPIQILGDDSVFVENVSMVARGVEGNCINATTLGGNGIANLWVKDCECENRAHSYYSRNGDPASAFRVCADQSTISDGEYTGKFENVTVTTTPHSAIYSVGSSDRRPVMIIHDCNLTVDAHNDMYDTSNATTFHSSGDPFAISVFRLGPGSQIYNNTIRSGMQYEGGQGMLIQGAQGTASNPIEIYDNDIQVHCGPTQSDLRYDGDGKSIGMYLRWPEGDSHMSNCYVRFHNNLIKVYGDALKALQLGGTLHTGGSAQGMRIHADSGFHHCDIFNNRVFALRSDSLVDTGYVETVAAMFAKVDTNRTDEYALRNMLDVHDNSFYGNYYYALSSPLYLGSIAQHILGGGDLVLYGDTLNCPVPADGNTSVEFPQYGTFRFSSTGSRLIDCTFLGYANDFDVKWGNINTDDNCLGKDLRYQRSVLVKAQNPAGIGIPHASVSIKNNYGQIIGSGPTSTSGEFSDTVTYKALHYNSPMGEECYWEDSLDYNNFMIKAKFDSDSVMTIIAINSETEFPIVLVLPVVIGPNNPPTVPEIFLPNDGDTLLGSTHDLTIYNSTDPEEDIVTYEFKICSDEGMSQVIEQQTSIPQGNTFTIFTTTEDFSQGETYHWQVRAFDGTDSSAWSQRRAFTHLEIISSAGDIPVPISPLDGDRVQNVRPVFSLQTASDDAGVSFYFEVCDNKDFMNAIVSGPVMGKQPQTSWQTDVNLDPNTGYYWHARAENSGWSDAISFAVQGEVHVAPNPYRPAQDGEMVTFKNIPETADITITTITGDVVREMHQVQGPEVGWDCRNYFNQPLASGVYLYFVSGKESSASGKLAVIR